MACDSSPLLAGSPWTPPACPQCLPPVPRPQPCTHPTLPNTCGLRAPPSPTCPPACLSASSPTAPPAPQSHRLTPVDPSCRASVGDPVVEGSPGVWGPLELAQRRQGWGPPHKGPVFSHKARLAQSPALRRGQGDTLREAAFSCLFSQGLWPLGCIGCLCWCFVFGQAGLPGSAVDMGTVVTRGHHQEPWQMWLGGLPGSGDPPLKGVWPC